jgi:hypothetical protein
MGTFLKELIHEKFTSQILKNPINHISEHRLDRKQMRNHHIKHSESVYYKASDEVVISSKYHSSYKNIGDIGN